jgi:hypothetical protein
MSWASNRVTTRPEDIAYCLLGIFEVNMPLIYGEGSNAFVRLQEEIMKHSVDQSLFAWWQEKQDDDADFYEDGYRGILARHPSEFKRAARIVHHSVPGEPYTMTNKGLRIQLPVKLRKDGCLCVVLNCHFENNLAGPIGIILIPNRDNALHGDSFFYHAGECLVVVPQKEALKAQSCLLYISKRDESHLGSRNDQKCWLRQLPESLKLAEAIFAPVQDIPDEISAEMQWDMEGRTMEMPFRWPYAAALRLLHSTKQEFSLLVQLNEPRIGDALLASFQPLLADNTLLNSLQTFGKTIKTGDKRESKNERRIVPYRKPYLSSHQTTHRGRVFTIQISNERIFGITTFMLDIFESAYEESMQMEAG